MTDRLDLFQLQQEIEAASIGYAVTLGIDRTDD
jgi:NTP pyrophosphatase (non-canonical NTP hydrolase)